MSKERLTVEVDTATPGEARLAMRGDVDIAADETLADAYAAAVGGRRRSAWSSTSRTWTTSTRPGSR